MKTTHVKQWAIQVAEAVEILNVAGVVHRFIRPENIILTPHRNGSINIKLTSFDFATRYWDSNTRSLIPLHAKLPIDVPPHLLNHLPPESFMEGHDGSMVDVWSIGSMICILLTDENPFVVPEMTVNTDSNTGSEINGGDVPDHLQRWKWCDERRMLPDEIRFLLDDIFKEANARINAWEVAKDKRLWCKNAKELNQMRSPDYYRIDLSKANTLLLLIY